MTLAPFRIALVGDLHAAWDDADAAYFGSSDYRQVLITGDLGSSAGGNGVKIAQSLSRIARDTLVMPGNNDARDYAAIVAELHYQAGRGELLAGLVSSRRGSALGRYRVQICGYSLHPMRFGDFEVTLVAGRPFAMGGSDLSFPRELRDIFRVDSIEVSTERLKRLIDEVETEHVLFLAHNGPSGLGDSRESPFGRDFHPNAGDWGDRDLAEAIAYAKQRGQKVLCVLAGHMHWSLRGGGSRSWHVEQDGVLYVNAARVPRHVRHGQGARRHHLALTLTPEGASVEEVWVFI
ncbi:MAG TPA: metallophosphoesterase [Polyangiaceae bacterium]|nr:metallophosphoesterase [Polyangiaceae bacterium]